MEHIDIGGPGRLRKPPPLLEVFEEPGDLPSRRLAGGIRQPVPFSPVSNELMQHGFATVRQASRFWPKTAKMTEPIEGRGSEMVAGMSARFGPAPRRMAGSHLPDLINAETVISGPAVKLDGHPETGSGFLDERGVRNALSSSFDQAGGTLVGQRAVTVTANNLRICE